MEKHNYKKKSITIRKWLLLEKITLLYEKLLNFLCIFNFFSLCNQCVKDNLP